MLKKLLPLALIACLFLLIVGAKWATFDRFGSAMPDWDQWDAEAVELFIPWYENDHFVSHLFHPHNEHRVVLTKLQNLTLGVINGQWDSRVEAATNALLHAALAAGFWVMGRRWMAARWHAVLFVVILSLFALPIAWQNILGGFHSQQYWLLGLSFVAIVILPFHRAWTAAWWTGVLAALLVLGSMGSGVIAAAVVLIVVAWRLWARETSWRDVWPTLAFMALLVMVGLLTRHEVEWHQSMKAKTAHDFLFSIIHSMQWPWRDQHWAAAALWLPWLLAVGRVVKGRRADSAGQRAGEAIAGLGGWVLVQLAATAYARGAGADYPASRYMDTVAFGAMVNGVAAGWLLSGGAAARPVPVAYVVLGIGWLCTLGVGLQRLLRDVVRYELVEARNYYDKAEGHMRRYLGTNDPRQLAYPEIPFPSADGLVERLAHPSLRALMPLPIRAPLPLTAAPGPGAGGFLENDARGSDVEQPPRAGLSPATPPLDATKTWGSFTGDGGAAAVGTWRSEPIPPPKSAWLKFETAGHVGEPGAALELHDASTGALLATVRPTKIPHDAWRAAYVRTPRVSFVVVARDADPTRWLAFSGPAEMGWLSHWAAKVIKHGLLLVYVMGAMSIVLGAASVVVERRRS